MDEPPRSHSSIVRSQGRITWQHSAAEQRHVRVVEDAQHWHDAVAVAIRSADVATLRAERHTPMSTIHTVRTSQKG